MKHPMVGLISIIWASIRAPYSSWSKIINLNWSGMWWRRIRISWRGWRRRGLKVDGFRKWRAKSEEWKCELWVVKCEFLVGWFRYGWCISLPKCKFLIAPAFKPGVWMWCRFGLQPIGKSPLPIRKILLNLLRKNVKDNNEPINQKNINANHTLLDRVWPENNLCTK